MTKPKEYKDKFGPIPPEHFDGDFPPAEAPPPGQDPVYDALDKHVREQKAAAVKKKT
jgi:hypothetical protein